MLHHKSLHNLEINERNGSWEGECVCLCVYKDEKDTDEKRKARIVLIRVT